MTKQSRAASTQTEFSQQHMAAAQIELRIPPDTVVVERYSEFPKHCAGQGWDARAHDSRIFGEQDEGYCEMKADPFTQ